MTSEVRLQEDRAAREGHLDRLGRAVSGFDDVIERWANDEQFRDDFRADPEAALRDSGIELTDEEWEAVRTTDTSAMDDAQLQERIAKEG